MRGTLRKAICGAPHFAWTSQLHYQPIVDFRTGLRRGRGSHPLASRNDGSGSGPDPTFPLAEECGLINEIGLWVLNDVCREQECWPTHT